MRRPARGQGPALRPFGRSLPMQLMRAREAVMQRFRPHLRDHGVTEQQWRIIRALVEVERLEIGELGARCCMLPASLSRILPRLEADGLIARRTHGEDHRRIVVSLAAKGRRLFETLAPRSEEIYAEIERAIGPERLAEVYRALDQVIERLAADGGGAEPDETG
ncbi:MAG: homoprotocatechuate degradation operon regulator HpaR [Xanthobacteraceae bacterium]|nr:homoprotocatechuate degradation operon regulator HpaR [Xanthobacteraceae bacterium]